MNMNRREFLHKMGKYGTAASLVSLGQLTMLQRAMAQTAPSFDDYKAMVCIFLFGGNDAYNMFVPIGTSGNNSHSVYQGIRGNLAVNNIDLGLATIAGGNNLNNGNLSTGTGNPYNVDETVASAYLRGIYDMSASGQDYGVNGIMPELAQLLTDNKATAILNSGTLVNPINKTEFENSSVATPLFLFAHNHQQRQLQIGHAGTLNDIGWLGRIADNWQGVNNNSPIGLGISINGNDRMMIGDNGGPLVISPGNVPDYNNLTVSSDDNEQDRRAIYQAINGLTNSTDSLTFNASNTFIPSDPFISLLNNSNISAFQASDALSSAFNNNNPTYTSTDPYGNPLFSVPTGTQLGFGDDDIRGSLIAQLETVAQLIFLGSSGLLGNNYNRQAFFVQLGGFDNHANQVQDHPLLLRELSLGLWSFQKAMQDLNLANNVTTFTMSDFGRTLSNNGDGTDHAWGSHQIVMGGDGNRTSGNLNGGVFGSYPDLNLGSDSDVSTRGRFIPTLAQEQTSAAIANWFGVSESIQQITFPNLSNFQSGTGLSSAYLNLFNP